MSTEMHTTIYINGQAHLCTGLYPVLFADSPSLPGRRCSQHTLTPMAISWLKNGGSVRTSGNSYSLSPPETKEKT